jgi:hypothetical protein
MLDFHFPDEFDHEDDVEEEDAAEDASSITMEVGVPRPESQLAASPNRQLTASRRGRRLRRARVCVGGGEDSSGDSDEFRVRGLETKYELEPLFCYNCCTSEKLL